jgi:hypothetical protein
MKGLRNSTWPTAARPSLLACVLAIKHERGLHAHDTVMAAYDQAVAMSEVKHVKTYVPPAPAPVELVRSLSITSVDNVEDDIEHDADDPIEVTYGISQPVRVAGEEVEGEQESEIDEEDSELNPEESEAA